MKNDSIRATGASRNKSSHARTMTTSMNQPVLGSLITRFSVPKSAGLAFRITRLVSESATSHSSTLNPKPWISVDHLW